MNKRIGYACQNTTLDTGASRTARLRNITADKLRELIALNLADLERILLWNSDHGIKFFRIGSGLIPFASHSVNNLRWEREFRESFSRLARFIAERDILVCMHPGQHTVLASPDPGVAERALSEIEYHSTVLGLLGQGAEAKITLHLGGAYGDKSGAIKRWQANLARLSPSARERILIENDGVIGLFEDCLRIHEESAVPVAFDVFHYRLEPGEPDPIAELPRALRTWAGQRGLPVIHYSEQAPGQRSGAHARSIEVKAFVDFYQRTTVHRFNIMLETKDKELSVLKVMRALTAEGENTDR